MNDEEKKKKGKDFSRRRVLWSFEVGWVWPIKAQLEK